MDPFEWYGSFDRLPGLYESDSSTEKLFAMFVDACGCVLNFHWNWFGVPNDVFVKSPKFCNSDNTKRKEN